VKALYLCIVCISADKNYVNQAAVPISPSTHAGEDVAIYAKGPMSHLFHSTHEQNYIPHVLAFTSCVGTPAQIFLEKGSAMTGYICYFFTEVIKCY
jgi:hypothetical protein